MSHDIIFYQQSRTGWSLLGGIALLHGLIFIGILDRASSAATPEMSVATPLSVRWITPAPEITPQPIVEQKMAKPEPAKPEPVVEPEPLPLPDIKKPSPVLAKPKPVKKQHPSTQLKLKKVDVQPQKETELSNSVPVSNEPKIEKTEIAPPPIEAPKFNAAYLSNPAPIYPRRSRVLEEEGVVKLKVHVSAAGKALQVQLFKSSGFSRLDEAALDAVKGWNFVPAKQGDQSIEGWVIVPISFKLRS
jgi:periplasmic protein TonB